MALCHGGAGTSQVVQKKEAQQKTKQAKIENRPKKRNPTQKQPAPVFF